jgi:hypothetical protein
MTKRRWAEWVPETKILENSPKDEPTKTTKTVFDVFVGSYSGEIPKIRPTRNPGLDWEPRTSILENLPESEPTKTSKTRPAPEVWVSWSAWQAAEINRIFAEHGSGGPGQITARTVQHGTDIQTECEERNL